MIKEYFTYPPLHHNITTAAGVLPPNLYEQERDWTCAIACFRSICNIHMSEEEFIDKYHPVMGPQFSPDIKAAGWVPEGFDVRYGCDDFSSIDASDLWYMLNSGYKVMVEWDLSAGHWCVLTSITPALTDSGYEMTCFDPYFKRMRVFDLGEFFCMCHDYIAVRKI